MPVDRRQRDRTAMSSRALMAMHLNGRPNDRWYPDLVGVVPRYPKSEQSWQTRRDVGRRLAATNPLVGPDGKRYTRKGIPDGWKGKRKEVQTILAKAKIEAEKLITKLEEYDALNLDVNEDPRVGLAFRTTAEIILANEETPEGKIVPLYSARDRLAAVNVFTSYLKTKPVSRLDARVTQAEDFLGLLVGSNYADGE